MLRSSKDSAKRKSYQHKPELPFTPGGEVAGTVAALGADVEGWSVGDRVYAMVRDGGYAERVVARVTALHPLPAGVDFAAAAALGIAYPTLRGSQQQEDDPDGP